jgi:hypothetical protein
MDRPRCVRDHQREGVVLLRTSELGVMFANFRVECRVERPLVVSERPEPPAYRGEVERRNEVFEAQIFKILE